MPPSRCAARNQLQHCSIDKGHEITNAQESQGRLRKIPKLTRRDSDMNRPSGKPTIYDVAEQVGASPSTVSAVLNGSWTRRRISETTVENIRKAAAELGYATNLQARGLRQARSGLVGMIIPIHDNRFFRRSARILTRWRASAACARSSPARCATPAKNGASSRLSFPTPSTPSSSPGPLTQPSSASSVPQRS